MLLDFVELRGTGTFYTSETAWFFSQACFVKPDSTLKKNAGRRNSVFQYFLKSLYACSSVSSSNPFNQNITLLHEVAY